MDSLRDVRLLIISDRYPHEHDSISSSFVKSQVDCLKEYVEHIYVVALTPFVPRFMSRLQFMNPRWRRDAFARNYEYDNVSVYFARYLSLPFEFSWGWRGDAALKAVEKILKKKNINFDLIHAHFTYPSGYVGKKMKNKFKVPLIITGHGYDIYDLPFKNLQWNMTIHDILTASDLIITPSRSNCKMIAKLGIPNKKICVMPNGYNSNLFIKRSTTDARKKLNMPEDKRIILNVGHLEIAKGHEYLIRAVEKISHEDVVCLIVGSGGLERKINHMIYSLNLDKYVKLLGARSHSEIPLWMNACDVFVLPSISESFGIVQIEAMACGKPVVATRNGGSEEIVINDRLGILVEPRDPEALAQAILQALKREWDYEYIREYAQQFTWERIAERIVEVYREVLS